MPRRKLLRLPEEDLLRPVVESLPNEGVEADLCRASVWDAVHSLSWLERHVIKARFFHKKKPLSYEVIGHRFGVSRETVRRIERRGLALLKELLGPSFQTKED